MGSFSNLNVIYKLFALYSRLGIGNLLEGLENELESNDDDDSDPDYNQDYEKKSDTAEDFSDITELAEDLQTAMQVLILNIKLFKGKLKLSTAINIIAADCETTDW